MKTSLLVAFIIVAFAAGVMYTMIVTSTQASPARTELTEREIRGVIAILERELESREQPENVAATPTTEPTTPRTYVPDRHVHVGLQLLQGRRRLPHRGHLRQHQELLVHGHRLPKALHHHRQEPVTGASLTATPMPLSHTPDSASASSSTPTGSGSFQVIEYLDGYVYGDTVIRKVLAGGDLPAGVTLHTGGEENHYLFTAIGNDFTLSINDSDVPISLSTESMDYLETRQDRGELVEGKWAKRGGAVKDKPFTGRILRKCRGT